MQERSTISVKNFITACAKIALVVLFIFFPGPGKIVDGRKTIEVRFGRQRNAHTLSRLAIWPRLGLESGQDLEDARQTAKQATRTGEGVLCSLQYSYNESGYFWPRRVDTAPLPDHFYLWLHLADGSWVRRKEKISNSASIIPREIDFFCSQTWRTQKLTGARCSSDRVAQLTGSSQMIPPF